MVSSTTIWSLCRWIWEEGAGLVRAGGESAPGHLRGSAGIDVTRKNSTKRTQPPHLGRSFSIVRVMGARSIAFAARCPETRRWVAVSPVPLAGGDRPAVHRYQWRAGVRARVSGRPRSVVLARRRQGGPGGDPTGVRASCDALAQSCFGSRNFELARLGSDMHPTVAAAGEGLFRFYK